MNKLVYLLAFLLAAPNFAQALEDTHGVLIDRGAVRSKTGGDAVPKPADSGKTDPSDKTKDDQDKSDNADTGKNSKTLANVPKNYKKIANNAGINAQNYYRAKHRGSMNTEVKD